MRQDFQRVDLAHRGGALEVSPAVRRASRTALALDPSSDASACSIAGRPNTPSWIENPGSERAIDA